LSQAEDYGMAMGFGCKNIDDIELECISDNDTISFGNSSITALHVPGHAAGSMAYVIDNPSVVFTGDVLFRQSIGRTDLPTGDYDVLMKMLNTKILTLDNDCEVLPGHGPNTTIGNEKNSNPFLL
jgi:glyoxylase-like metal-dependent hydrolase (beta-lactamase superfamily II)